MSAHESGSPSARSTAFEAPPSPVEEGVSLDDSDPCEPLEPDSPEGQLILVEAVRSLERRLSPEARATIRNASKDPYAETEDPEEFNPAT